jgi:putative membrane protein
MMKHLGKVLAAGGLVLAIWLFLRDDPTLILDLLRQAGPGLILAALVHVIPMAFNAQAWRIILPGAGRPDLAAMLRVVWIREAVNGLLPVARIGGEVASYRLLRQIGIRRAPAVASLTVDVALSIVSQLVFALAGVAVLINARGTGLQEAGHPVMLQIIGGLLLLAVLAVLFITVQHAGLFERLMRVLNHVAAGRFEAAIGHSAQIDRAVQLMYRRRGPVLCCVLWQLVGWAAGGAEIWAALWFLGQPVSVIDAIAIEAVIQAVSSAAFLIPGALGVQEAAFLFVGAALGLEPATALALAAARRIRDCVVFMPGLVSWQMAENRAVRDPR